MVRLKMTVTALEALARQLRIAGVGCAAYFATSSVLGSSWTRILAGALTWAVLQGLALLVSSLRFDESS